MTGWTPYCGPGATPLDLWSRSNTDPVLLAVLMGAFALVLVRTDRSDRLAAAAGLGVLAVIFVSPLCALSSALFSARTGHHLLLMAVAAPLLAMGLPRLRGLAFATLVQTVVLWAWHAPAAYASALSNEVLYWIMQGSLLGAAVWFWAAIRSTAAPAAVAALLATLVQTGLLGAILTFAPEAVYAPHLETTVPWGLTPLEDQQLAGVIMWAPGAAVYLAAALGRLARRLGLHEGARTA